MEWSSFLHAEANDAYGGAKGQWRLLRIIMEIL